MTRELEAVVASYLDSHEFNGLYFASLPSGWKADSVRRLVTDGLVQVVSDQDYPNMHIRPWVSHRSVVEQVATLDDAVSGRGACCLYPTLEAMRGRDLSRFDGQPYTQAVAEGEGVLELRYFEMAAVEPYRNDPRYRFVLNDFGFSFGIGDDAYLDAAEPDHDKIHTVRAGFGFPEAALKAGATDFPRYACAFLTDLWKVTPRHQRRLATWQVDDSGLTPHPTWWRMQMGHWAEHIGPFEKILAELEALNELWQICFGAELFRNVERPRDWGWVLRPSSNEWDGFMLTTDKLLSDNLSKAGLDAAGAPTLADDGARLGTLSRLEQLLLTRSSTSADSIRSVLKPLRDVRKQRQRPAHSAVDPLTDRSVFHRQRVVLGAVAGSLEALRVFLSRHPKVRAASWKAEDYLDDWLTL